MRTAPHLTGHPPPPPAPKHRTLPHETKRPHAGFYLTPNTQRIQLRRIQAAVVQWNATPGSSSATVLFEERCTMHRQCLATVNNRARGRGSGQPPAKCAGGWALGRPPAPRRCLPRVALALAIGRLLAEGWRGDAGGGGGNGLRGGVRQPICSRREGQRPGASAPRAALSAAQAESVHQYRRRATPARGRARPRRAKMGCVVVRVSSDGGPPPSPMGARGGVERGVAKASHSGIRDTPCISGWGQLSGSTGRAAARAERAGQHGGWAMSRRRPA